MMKEFQYENQTLKEKVESLNEILQQHKQVRYDNTVEQGANEDTR